MCTFKIIYFTFFGGLKCAVYDLCLWLCLWMRCLGHPGILHIHPFVCWRFPKDQRICFSSSGLKFVFSGVPARTAFCSSTANFPRFNSAECLQPSGRFAGAADDCGGSSSQRRQGDLQEVDRYSPVGSQTLGGTEGQLQQQQQPLLTDDWLTGWEWLSGWLNNWLIMTE